MTSSRTPDQESSSAPATKTLRQPYQTPVLIVYGNVAKLTNTLTGNGGDGGVTGMRAKACL